MKWSLWAVVWFVGVAVFESSGEGAHASRKTRADASERSVGAKRDDAAAVGASAKLDLNVASVDELSTLPGIGPKRARAIAAYRERHRFARTRELRRIRGIGPKTFQRLQAHVTVGASPPPGASKGKSSLGVDRPPAPRRAQILKGGG